MMSLFSCSAFAKLARIIRLIMKQIRKEYEKMLVAV